MHMRVPSTPQSQGGLKKAFSPSYAPTLSYFLLLVHWDDCNGPRQ